MKKYIAITLKSCICNSAMTSSNSLSLEKCIYLLQVSYPCNNTHCINSRGQERGRDGHTDQWSRISSQYRQSHTYSWRQGNKNSDPQSSRHTPVIDYSESILDRSCKCPSITKVFSSDDEDGNSSIQLNAEYGTLNSFK